MKNLVFAATVVALASSGCFEDGEQVALNERLFDAQSMQSEGAGCTLYVLGGKASESTSTNALEFIVSQRLTESDVRVSVTHGTDAVVSRQYDNVFFQAGAVDEFVAPSTSGRNLLLRYWGTYHPGGVDGCAPLDSNGPR